MEWKCEFVYHEIELTKLNANLNAINKFACFYLELNIIL